MVKTVVPYLTTNDDRVVIESSDLEEKESEEKSEEEVKEKIKLDKLLNCSFILPNQYLSIDQAEGRYLFYLSQHFHTVISPPPDAQSIG
ncbi:MULTISPECIES: hypothetical protein [Reichenbachiella]|nr:MULTISPECIES: hypothetical protein [Reichenbachiella]MBU2913166.1 hypothetical protein [Reichenbachiella agariperforans]RJE74835.1 hypothetical protein BGP76_17055 [Reichenbachiella sp. MSK19-1]